MKFYRFLLRFIQIFVVLVVLPRVASFVGNLGNNQAGFDLHDLIRFAFAASLGLGTVATSYFSNDTQAPEYEDEPTNRREQRRREREAIYYATMLAAAPYARGAMWLFAILDGSFNMADAFMGASAAGILDVANQGMFLVGIYGTATFLFGVSPTVLAIVLSKVVSMVDRIPDDYERPATKKQMDILRTVLGNLGLQEYGSSNVAALTNGQHALPEPSVERSTVRPDELPVGEQSERVYRYLNSYVTQHEITNPDQLPGPTAIQNVLDDPPAKSTISVARSAWIRKSMEVT